LEIKVQIIPAEMIIIIWALLLMKLLDILSSMYALFAKNRDLEDLLKDLERYQTAYIFIFGTHKNIYKII